MVELFANLFSKKSIAYIRENLIIMLKLFSEYKSNLGGYLAKIIIHFSVVYFSLFHSLYKF